MDSISMFMRNVFRDIRQGSDAVQREVQPCDSSGLDRGRGEAARDLRAFAKCVLGGTSLRP